MKKLPNNWARCGCEPAGWYERRSSRPGPGLHHDNPSGPCCCGATHNYMVEPDYRDILVF